MKVRQSCAILRWPSCESLSASLEKGLASTSHIAPGDFHYDNLGPGCCPICPHLLAVRGGLTHFALGLWCSVACTLHG